jgi:hypothetical protein
VSLISPSTGAPDDERAAASSPATPATSSAEESFVVPLYHARWRHFVWAIVLGGLGALFVASFSGLGRGLGLVLLALAVWPSLEFFRTLAHEAGSIAASASTGLALPPRLCAGRRAEVPLTEVKHAYFLRRELPWMTTGPLLVVETRRGTFAYPRDWFASEQDQRRLIVTINRWVGRTRA